MCVCAVVARGCSPRGDIVVDRLSADSCRWCVGDAETYIDPREVESGSCLINRINGGI